MTSTATTTEQDSTPADDHTPRRLVAGSLVAFAGVRRGGSRRARAGAPA